MKFLLKVANFREKKIVFWVSRVCPNKLFGSFSSSWFRTHQYEKLKKKNQKEISKKYFNLKIFMTWRNRKKSERSLKKSEDLEDIKENTEDTEDIIGIWRKNCLKNRRPPPDGKVENPSFIPARDYRSWWVQNRDLGWRLHREVHSSGN